MSRHETYGVFDISVEPLPIRGSTRGLVLHATEKGLPYDEPFTLEATYTLSAQASRPVPPHLVDFEASALAFMHALLDFGMYEKGAQCRWHTRSDDQVVEPPLRLDTPDLGDDSERRLQYLILNALRRARARMPRDYEKKQLDPEGACMVLDIDRTRFEYVVGRLNEGGYIKKYLQGSLYHGDIYITEEGIRELEAMSRRSRPKWLTSEAPEEIQEQVPQIVHLIQDWIPKQRSDSEQPYEFALAEYLEGQGVAAPEQQGASLADVLAAHGIAIEVKVNPDRSEYDRMCGQIMRHVEEHGIVIVLILRPDKRDLLDEYTSRFAGDDRVIFITKG